MAKKDEFTKEDLKKLEKILGSMSHHLMCYLYGEEFAENCAVSLLYGKVVRNIERMEAEDGKDKD